MTNPFRVKPVDYFEHIVIAATDTHLYRIAGTSYEKAAKTDLGTWSTVSTFTNVESGFIADTNLLILDTGTIVVIGETAGQKKIFRSANDGSSWSLVSNVDAGGLGGNRGWCVANGVIYFGEYDATGANTTVKLYKIEDDGATLSTLNTWTGSNGVLDAGTVKHFHCVNYEAGYVYIGFGDGGANESQCGMVRWDVSVGDWANVGDTAPADISAEGFIGVGSSQKYRATDIVAFNGKLYNFSDASKEFVGDGGVWQCDLDLTNFVNINNEVNFYTEYAGYYSVATPSQVLFVPYVAASGGVDNQIDIWAYKPNSTCRKVATFRCADIAAQKNISGFFYDDGKVYLTVTNGAGDNKNTKSTTVIEVTNEEFKGPLLDVVHPVYWANSTGSASNDASDPRNAKLTLNDCLSSSSTDQVSQGACVMVEDSSYTEAGFTYGNWNTTTNAAENVYTQVRGSGKTATVIDFTSGTNALTQGSFNAKLLLSDLTLDHNGNAGGAIWIGSASTTGELTVQDCVLGLAGSDYKRNLYVKDSLVKAYRTLFNAGSGTVPNHVTMTDNDGGAYTNYKFQGYACIFNGSHRSAFVYYGGTYEAYNCAFVNYTLEGIGTQSSSTVNPKSFGCVFIGLLDTSANTPYGDTAGQTWDGTNNDYNMMDRSSSTDGVPNLEYGENSMLFMSLDPIRLRTAGNFFADPLNLDFTPTASQKLMYKMPQQYTEFGYDGVAFTSTPSIGVYGDAAAAGSGTGEQAIISHNIIKH